MDILMYDLYFCLHVGEQYRRSSYVKEGVSLQNDIDVAL